jgi:hypothetical protein
MRSNVLAVSLCALALGCDVEGGSRPGERPRPTARDSGFRFQMAPDTGAPPAPHAAFDRRRETVAPGVSRVTISMIADVTQGRQALVSAMENVVQRERERDSTVAAVRVSAFAAPGPGGAREALLEVATMDWVPLTGWDSLTAMSRAAFHRTHTVLFVELPETLLPHRSTETPPAPAPRPR